MRCIVSLAALILALSPADTVLCAQHINPVVDLLRQRQTVFSLYIPANPRGRGRGAAPVQASQKTPSQLAQEAVSGRGADYLFDGGLEGDFDRGYSGFATFMNAMLQLPLPQRRSHPVIVKTHKISENPQLAAERIARQLDLGTSGVVFVEVETADELRTGLAAMRFRANGGTRPDRVGDAASFWGLTEREYRARADVWPLNASGELVAMAIVETKEGLANVREIAAVSGLAVLLPGAGSLRGVFTDTAGGERVFRETEWERAIQQVLAACREFNVPCGYPAGAADIEMRMKQGFSVFISSWNDNGFQAVQIGRKAAGRPTTP